LNKALREVVDWVVIIAVAFAASYGLRHWVVLPYRIQMSSMETTVFPDDLVMVDKVSYRFHEPRRGDVIIFWPPGVTTGDPYIKRVIGLPGETVEAREGKVFIDGKPVDEPYIHGYVMPDFGPTPVPQGSSLSWETIGLSAWTPVHLELFLWIRSSVEPCLHTGRCNMRSCFVL